MSQLKDCADEGDGSLSSPFCVLSTIHTHFGHTLPQNPADVHILVKSWCVYFSQLLK